MIIIIVGKNGAGKTLFLVYLAKKYDKPVLSNFNINLPHCKPLKLIDLLHLPNSHNIYLDEGYTWLESRTSMSDLNRYISKIGFQKRKRDINIYITLQMYSTIDKRFREQADYLIIAHTRLRDNDDFIYTIINVNRNSIGQILIPYSKMEQFFSLYNTLEIVEPYNITRMEFKLIEQDTELLLEYTKKISEVVLQELDFKDITKDNVKAVLILKRIYIGFSYYVYLYLKNKIKSWNNDNSKAKQSIKSTEV